MNIILEMGYAVTLKYIIIRYFYDNKITHNTIINVHNCSLILPVTEYQI